MGSQTLSQLGPIFRHTIMVLRFWGRSMLVMSCKSSMAFCPTMHQHVSRDPFLSLYDAGLHYHSYPQLLLLFRDPLGSECGLRLQTLASMERVETADELLCHGCSTHQ